MARLSSSKLVDYLNNLYASSGAAHEKISNSLSEYEAKIQLSPYEAKLIQMLIKLHGAKQVLEIGSLGGFSAYSIAKILPDGGSVTCIEKSEKHAKLIEQNLAELGISNAKVIHDDAKLALSKFEDSSFDAVFIDADKASYPSYLEEAFRILKVGGLLLADNTLLFGNVYDEPYQNSQAKLVEAMKEFNQALADSARWFGLIIPTSEGLSVAIKV